MAVVIDAVTDETPKWTLPPTPELQLGAVDGDHPYLFSGVIYAARLQTGTIVVADAASREVRFFDGTGRHVATAGGEGEGPGEFQSINRVLKDQGDTLHVHDAQLARIIRIAPDGLVAGGIPAPDRGVLGLSPAIVAMTSGARYVVSSAATSNAAIRNLSAGDTARFDRLILIADFVTNQVDTIAVLEGPLLRMNQMPGSRAVLLQQLPLSHSVLAEARSDRVIVSSTDEYEILQFAPSGELELVMRRADVTPVTADDEVADRFESAAPEQILAAIPNLRELIRGSRLATHESIFMSDDQNIWIQDPTFPWATPTSARYVVFRDDGTIAATVELPSSLDILHIGHEHVTGRFRDTLGVEHVAVYNLERG